MDGGHWPPYNKYMNETGLSKLFRRLTPWRGAIIGIICGFYLFLSARLADYSKVPTFWENFVFVVVLIIMLAGMILHFIELVRRKRS
jgi:hypothetical protein